MGGNNIQKKISIFERINALNSKHEPIKEREICSRVFHINSSSYEKTHKYLKEKQNFLFCNFDEQREVLKNETRFSNRLSVEECISFGKILEFWLGLSEKMQIIARCSDKKVLYCYIICYLRFFKEKTYIDAEHIVGGAYFSRECHFMNFSNYFDDFLRNKKFKSLNLHQIVISTIPRRKNDSEKPFLKPFYSIRIVEKPIIPKVQHDENHIICKMDVIVRSDLTLEFFRNSTKLFSLFLNTISFDEGLYRFSEKDCILESGTVLSSDFSIDVFFFSSNERTKHVNFDAKAQIADRLVGTFDRKSYDNFKKIGIKHEDALVKVLSQDSSSIELQLKTLADNISVSNNIPVEQSILFIRPYEPDDTIELTDLELVLDTVPMKNTVIKTPKRKMAPVRKTKTISEKKEESIVVKPFYWAVIPKSCDSIFNDLSDVRTYIDCTKFEEWFSVTTDSHKFRIEKQKGTIIKDARRLFLVSISLKTFEKRELSLNAISLNKMLLDDLIIIERIVPIESEYQLLKSNSSKCNEIETKMIEFYKYRNLVKILVFERKFFEIKDKWMTSVSRIKDGFDEILNSNNIRILLKMVLELGNLINTNYGNNRKEASAFRITSLLLTKQYRGNTKNQSLLKFVADSAKSRLRNFEKEIEDLEMLKKEDIAIYRESINEYILEYKDLKTILPELDSQSRASMKAFFKYFTDYITKFKASYKETTVYSSIIKRKFGEPEEKNVKEIIRNLYDFMKLVQEELIN